MLERKEAKLSNMILGLKNKQTKKNITEQYCIFREGFYNSWSWVDGYLNCKNDWAPLRNGGVLSTGWM